MRRFVLCFVLALAVAATGCGGRKPVYPYKGKLVTADDKPAAGTLVICNYAGAPDEQPKPTGTTDEQGVFSLTTHAQNDGAPEGEYVVTVVWAAPRKTPFDPPGEDRLGGKLSSPEKSSLRLKVEKKNEGEPPVLKLP